METELKLTNDSINGEDTRIRVFVNGEWVATYILELTSPTSLNLDIVRDESNPCRVMVQMLDENTIDLVHQEYSGRRISVDLDWTEPETDGITAAGRGYGQ